MIRRIIGFLVLCMACIACSSSHLDYRRVKGLQMGDPIVQGKYLHVPILTRGGYGFRQPMTYLCKSKPTLKNRAIVFHLESCVFVPRFLKPQPLIRLPVLSMVHNGPGRYTVDYIDRDKQITHVASFELEAAPSLPDGTAQFRVKP